MTATIFSSNGPGKPIGIRHLDSESLVGKSHFHQRAESGPDSQSPPTTVHDDDSPWPIAFDCEFMCSCGKRLDTSSLGGWDAGDIACPDCQRIWNVSLSVTAPNAPREAENATSTEG